MSSLLYIHRISNSVALQQGGGSATVPTYSSIIYIFITSSSSSQERLVLSSMVPSLLSLRAIEHSWIAHVEDHLWSRWLRKGAQGPHRTRDWEAVNT